MSWLRPVAGLALLLAAGWLGWVLLNQSGSEVGGRLLPSLVVLLWLLVLNAVLLTFPAVPARLEQGAGLIRRVINLLQRSLFSLLALLLHLHSTYRLTFVDSESVSWYMLMTWLCSLAVSVSTHAIPKKQNKWLPHRCRVHPRGRRTNK